MTDRPKVSVIIPHYRDFEHLDACLRSVAAQSYPAARVEVIVGDNGSPEGIERVREVAAGRAQVLLVEERGAGPARNGAVAHATGEVLAFIDSDCVAEPQWIEEGVRALSGYDFVGGQVKVLVQDEARMTPVEAWERVFAFDFKSYIEKKGFTGSGNLFCPRRVFDAVGGFRVGISEDTEWSLRAVAAGFRLGYAPKAVVGHPARRTWEELTRKWRRLGDESYGLSAGRPGRRLRWAVRGLLMPASAVAHTPKVLLHPGLHTLSQRLAALRVLYAIRFWRLADAVRVLRADARKAA
jgi:GT2 family glycosyltransferase